MEEKVAVISGVASGIGKYIADELEKMGVKVFGLDINEIVNDKIHFFQCNVAHEDEVIGFVERITNYTDKVDYLINVAGILCYQDRYFIEKLPITEWNKVMENNVTSVFLMTKYLIPLLKKSNNGNIINFSTDQVAIVRKKSVPYAVSKAAIEMFSKIAALELLADGIRVNVVALSSVNTEFIKEYIQNENKFKKKLSKADKEMPFGLIQPEDVFNLILYLIDKSNKITGQTILIDSGVTFTQNRR